MNDYKQEALLFKAFCDENRLQIIDVLGEGEQCACNLLERLTIGQSTLSHHMKILVESGVVTARRESKWTYYSINDTGSQLARDALEKILTKQTEPLVQCKCD